MLLPYVNSGKLLVIFLIFALCTKKNIAAESATLLLEVSLSKEKTNIIIPVLQDADGSLSVTRGSLEDAGIIFPDKGSKDELINLSKADWIKYDYDALKQSIDITVPSSYRKTKIFQTSYEEKFPITPSTYGLYINYGLFTGASYQFNNNLFSSSGTTLNLDANLFSVIGTFNQSLSLLKIPDFEPVRGITSWQYTEPHSALTFVAGDFSSGALNWTGSIRGAGFQIKRNFTPRPDLILVALPSLNGTAALPSTVDVFINNEPRLRREVGSGPFFIEQTPVFSGPGTVTMVIQDSAGNIQKTNFDFMASPNMLAKGVVDFSLDSGLPRVGYTDFSWDYTLDPFGTASVRVGASNYLTIETHLEASGKLFNMGIGGITNLIPKSTFSLAANGSYFRNEVGFQAFASYNIQLSMLSISANARRNFMQYANLGVATRVIDPSEGIVPIIDGSAQESLAISYSFIQAKTSLSLLGAHSTDALGSQSWLTVANANQTFSGWVSLGASVFGRFSQGQYDFGIYANISIPLGTSGLSASTGGAASLRGQRSTYAQVSGTSAPEFGTVSWQAFHQQDNSETIGANADIISKAGHASGQLVFSYPFSGCYANWRGSLAITKAGMFFGDEIQDSFGIISIGSPDVGVRVNGIYQGTTPQSGKLLVPRLNSYRSNKISLDMRNLPVMAEIPQTELSVVPKEKTGLLIDFGKVKVIAGAVLVLVDTNKEVISMGTPVKLDGNEEIFVVGKKGETYVTGLQENNILHSYANGKECITKFEFKANQDIQQTIGPLICTPLP